MTQSASQPPQSQPSKPSPLHSSDNDSSSTNQSLGKGNGNKQSSLDVLEDLIKNAQDEISPLGDSNTNTQPTQNVALGPQLSSTLPPPPQNQDVVNVAKQKNKEQGSQDEAKLKVIEQLKIEKEKEEEKLVSKQQGLIKRAAAHSPQAKIRKKIRQEQEEKVEEGSLSSGMRIRQLEHKKIKSEG